MVESAVGIGVDGKAIAREQIDDPRCQDRIARRGVALVKQDLRAVPYSHLTLPTTSSVYI